MNYKDGFDKLQKITEEMESGELSLEEMVDRYEEGMKIYGTLSKKLDDFEKRVSLLHEGKETLLKEEEFAQAEAENEVPF